MHTAAEIYIGWDSRETIAYHVLSHSIITRSSIPVCVHPVGNQTLPKSVWWREKGPHDSTEFSNARFAIPALRDFHGWALFMDCDMVCLSDIADLWSQRDERFAVMVVKHDHRPAEQRKFLGATQASYWRKNWSSLMLINCGHEATRKLTRDFVNTSPGLGLHGFTWCAPGEIGEIEGHWNVLSAQGLQHPEFVGPQDVDLLHYTLGGPWHGYEPEGYGHWLKEFESMIGRGNPCASVITQQGDVGTTKFSGRFQRREP